MSISQPISIKCQVMNYDWGTKGSDSLVAKLSGIQSIEPGTPYAELWIGAHPKAPAQTEFGSLLEVIKSQPDMVLGKSVAEKFNNQLPFLFKVLSIDSALSIQAHPDLKLAKALHDKDPINYPDDNHKPEIAIAIKETEVLYGFKPLHELRLIFRKTEELTRLVPHELLQKFLSPELDSEQLREIFKVLYKSILESSADTIKVTCDHLKARLDLKSKLADHEKWMRQLCEKYPAGDVGIMHFYLLNYAKLQPGDALYVKANQPHAYLKGELVECMANSDNVVRAGLTTKFKDIDTLQQMLSYEFAPFEPRRAEPVSSYLSRYSCDAEEFEIEKLVDKCVLKDRECNSAEIIFSLNGSGEILWKDGKIDLTKGSAVFVPANTDNYTFVVNKGEFFRVYAR